MSKMLSRYRPAILQATEGELRADVTLTGSLLIEKDGALTVSYAPFEHIQNDARIVIVGITPGAQQASNALVEVRRQMIAGASDAGALESAKVFASFSGPMRTNLVAMLDHIGVQRLVSISSCASLWHENAGLAHFTSALRYPVFVDGANYNRQRPILSTPALVHLLESCLAEEAAALPKALWVPLGPVATQAVGWLVSRRALPANRVLVGLPHPSGANAERIAYFLGRKRREELSMKTNGVALDATKATLLAQVAGMSGFDA